MALDTDDDRRSKILNRVMETKLATLLSSLKAKNADSVFLDYDSKMFRLFFAVSRKKQSCNEQNDLVHDEERKCSQKLDLIIFHINMIYNYFIFSRNDYNDNSHYINKTKNKWVSEWQYFWSLKRDTWITKFFSIHLTFVFQQSIIYKTKRATEIYLIGFIQTPWFIFW